MHGLVALWLADADGPGGGVLADADGPGRGRRRWCDGRHHLHPPPQPWLQVHVARRSEAPGLQHPEDVVSEGGSSSRSGAGAPSHLGC